MAQQSALVIGCGIAGIATAYYLSKRPEIGQITLVDRGQPMAFTSAQSGENYRNWWPHPTMTAFTDLSISLMEDIARETHNGFNMTRRGYVLVSRRHEIDDLVGTLEEGYAGQTDKLRFFEAGAPCSSYQAPLSADWTQAPDGVDILRNPDLIKRTFPSYDPEIASALHIRRAGDVSGQQLGQIMLDAARASGAKRVSGEVVDIANTGQGFTATVAEGGTTQTLKADLLINAAGPFIDRIGAMLGYDLPVQNVRQQKIAFEDRHGAIPRDMPFSIDLDGQLIDWGEEDRALLADDPGTAWLAAPMPGGIHCKAEGWEHGTWVKLGWAYTTQADVAGWEPELSDSFPEVVLHGAARLNPALKAYYGQLPRQMSHYGGYYTMTEENWPLIGPAGPDGSFVVGALSGFGTMAAAASGYLLAQHVAGADLPDFAADLSLARYSKPEFVQSLVGLAGRSVL